MEKIKVTEQVNAIFALVDMKSKNNAQKSYIRPAGKISVKNPIKALGVPSVLLGIFCGNCKKVTKTTKLEDNTVTEVHECNGCKRKKVIVKRFTIKKWSKQYIGPYTLEVYMLGEILENLYSMKNREEQLKYLSSLPIKSKILYKMYVDRRKKYLKDFYVKN